MRPVRAAALALVLLSDLGCGIGLSTEPDPNPCSGTFDGNVSGSGTAPNASFSGCSVYSTNGAFELRLSQSQHLITLGGSGARPTLGTHAIGKWDVSTPPPRSASYSFFSSPQRIFYSESGTLTITESTPGKLKGSLTMSVSERTLTPATASVTATFDATCKSGGQITC